MPSKYSTKASPYSLRTWQESRTADHCTHLVCRDWKAGCILTSSQQPSSLGPGTPMALNGDHYVQSNPEVSTIDSEGSRATYNRITVPKDSVHPRCHRSGGFRYTNGEDTLENTDYSLCRETRNKRVRFKGVTPTSDGSESSDYSKMTTRKPPRADESIHHVSSPFSPSCRGSCASDSLAKFKDKTQSHLTPTGETLSSLSVSGFDGITASPARCQVSENNSPPTLADLSKYVYSLCINQLISSNTTSPNTTSSNKTSKDGDQTTGTIDQRPDDHSQSENEASFEKTPSVEEGEHSNATSSADTSVEEMLGNLSKNIMKRVRAGRKKRTEQAATPIDGSSSANLQTIDQVVDMNREFVDELRRSRAEREAKSDRNTQIDNQTNASDRTMEQKNESQQERQVIFNCETGESHVQMNSTARPSATNNDLARDIGGINTPIMKKVTEKPRSPSAVIEASADQILRRMLDSGMITHEDIKRTINSVGEKRIWSSYTPEKSTVVEQPPRPRTPAEMLNDTFSSTIDRILVPNVNKRSISLFNQIEYSMQSTVHSLSEIQKIDYVRQQVRQSNNDELIKNLDNIFMNQLPRNYAEFTKQLLRKEFKAPKELAEQLVKSKVTNIKIAYQEISEEVKAQVKGKLTNDEIANIISNHMPESVKRGLVESLHTLEAAGTQLSPSAGLALADNMRAMMAATVEKKDEQVQRSPYKKRKFDRKKQFTKQSPKEKNKFSNQHSAAKPSTSTAKTAEAAGKMSHTWLCKVHRKDKKAPADKCKRPEHCNFKKFQMNKVSSANK